MAEPFIHSVDELAGAIPDGALLALPRELDGPAMAVVRALIRRGVRGLRLVCVPQGGLQADLLIGAGCVAALETSAQSLGELGPAPCFRRAVHTGDIELRDATCPAIHAGLRAAEAGIPFMPLRGVLGSDLIRHRSDWRVIDNPMADGGDPILVVPAIKPNFALFHALRADRDGNVWIGTQRTLMTMAHAAAATLVTVEEVVEQSLLAEEASAAGTIPALYVRHIAQAKRGAWPLGLIDHYPADDAHLAAYAAAAATEAGFARYLTEHVAPARAAE